MNIERHEVGNSGHSSDGFGSRDSVGPLRFRLSQPCDETADCSPTGLLVRELQQRINDLQARVEHLQDRLLPPQHTVPAFDTNVEPQPAFDDSDDVAGAQPSPVERENCCRLDDLPCGPLSIDVVAKALGKTGRTLRGWCQIEKYEIPAHKEAGQWRFYRDELLAWYADYERVSRRDAKRAQSKRRRTKHDKQDV